MTGSTEATGTGTDSRTAGGEAAGTQERGAEGYRASRLDRATSGSTTAVSVVVPVTERPEPLDRLYREYVGELERAVGETEFVFVAPAWRREALAPLRNLRSDGEPIRVVEVGGEITEAGLLKAAADRATGDVILTLPAYHRVEARALPRLVEAVATGDADVAIACRSPRRDPWINRIQNRMFHVLLRLMVGSTVRDTACGVRALRPDVLDSVPLYGDFSRFLPVLAAREGFRVEEIEAEQHPRDTDPRVYSPGVYVRRLIDLLGLFFLTRFTYKPLRFFGLVGGGLGGAGAVILGLVFFQRMGGQPLADRPLLVLGVLLATLGVQAVALGLVGEIIVHFNVPERPGYRVVEEIGEDG